MTPLSADKISRCSHTHQLQSGLAHCEDCDFDTEYISKKKNSLRVSPMPYRLVYVVHPHWKSSDDPGVLSHFPRRETSHDLPPGSLISHICACNSLEP